MEEKARQPAGWGVGVLLDAGSNSCPANDRGNHSAKSIKLQSINNGTEDHAGSVNNATLTSSGCAGNYSQTINNGIKLNDINY